MGCDCMHKKFTIIIALIIILITIIVFLEPSPPSEITVMYNDFLSSFSEGTYSDIDPYLHYEIPEHRILNEQYFANISKHDIKNWKMLNSNLWVAKTYIQLDYEEKGNICYHFVGMIEGEWRIMLGQHHVPSELSRGIDLTKYIPANSLP